MTKLFSYASQQEVMLAASLKSCGDVLQQAKTYALLYAPNRCRFGLLNGNGVPCDAVGAPIDLAPVYEARIFNREAELRWLNTGAGIGRAVLLSESEQNVNGYRALVELVAIKQPLHQSYLLWGIGVERSPGEGWSRLTTARVGGIDVPIDISASLALAGPRESVRVLLDAKEYLAETDSYGNVVVQDERLCGLRDVIVRLSNVSPADKLGAKETSNG